MSKKIYIVLAILCLLLFQKIVFAEVIYYEEISLSGTETIYTPGTATVSTLANGRFVDADLFFIGPDSTTILRFRCDGSNPTDSSPKLYDSGYYHLYDYEEISDLKIKLSAGSVGTATIMYSTKSHP